MSINSFQYIGKPLSRVDGRAKVTGEAKYAAEFNAPDLYHGVVISSPISKGKIRNIDATKALKIKGVYKIFTHENAPSLAWLDLKYKDMDAPPGSPFRPLGSNEIKFNQQPIALVVAETLELARYASTLVELEFDQEESVTNLEANLDKSYDPRTLKAGYKKPKSRGNFKKSFNNSDVQLNTLYFHGAEHHNPLEMHGSTVLYEEDGSIVVYDKTQGVLNSQHYISMVFGLSKKKVRVLSPYVGGAFGSGLRPQYQLFMAVLAATQMKHSIKVSLTRQQMFSFGHRPVTVQKLSIGASKEGKLQAISHSAYSETSQFEDYVENIVNWSGMLYDCENIKLKYQLVKLDMYTPIDMRAPGAATGVHALECAIDELSYKLNLDPLELRLKNYTEKEPTSKKPFSSKELKLCYKKGAEKFEWSKRNPLPRSMKEGNNLIGWGMATGIWDAQQVPARAKGTLTSDGKLVISSATADIGTGTYTIMTQIAAEAMGISHENVTFQLGDSNFPFAFIEGGSSTASSVGTAVKYVCEKIKQKLFKLAKKLENSPFANIPIEEVTFENGSIISNSDVDRALTISEILSKTQTKGITEKSTVLPQFMKQRKFARNTHSAVFAEVKVDEELGMIQVSRVVSAIAAGRILNPKTARSQILGGIVWGISMALHEDSFMDHNYGRFMNHNLSEYHIPVNKDIEGLEVIFVEEEDQVVSPIGVKGVGEIGLVGVAAAIANAIFHATGKRIKDLPITLDKLL